jgi:hypothetical protein
MLLLVLSCARAQAPGTPAPGGAAGPAGARAGTPATRPPATGGGVAEPAAPLPAPALPVPASFRAAVAKGTRTATGRPGPKYWQQRVDYRIDAELDPRSARVSGEEHVVYVNASPDTLTSLVLHLYQNLFRPGAPRTEATPTTEGMVLEAVRVDGRVAPEVRGAPEARPFYQVDNTLMGLALRRPLLPGDTARLDISWHFTVPPAGAPRMGHEGRSLFEVAQWYPQVAVYDDLRGWDTHPYLGTGEFYLEYGDFDVALTLPEGYLVAATGVLGNPEDVLTGSERERLALALRVDTVVHVVGLDDQLPGVITQQAPGAQLTWRFHAHDVRDFAFAASNRYLWDATHTDVDNDGDGKPEAVRVSAFYRPDARNWRQAAAYARHAIAFHSAHWKPYLYPQVTAAEGPEQGMEYPMLVFVSAYSDAGELLSVVTHEVGHQWFPMMVGSNEHEHAWQDEGVNTYIEELATLDYAPGTDVWGENMTAYLGIAGSDAEVPMMRPADLYGSEGAYSVASYMKPALALRVLESVIGADRVQEGLRQYTAAWLLRHPAGQDFFNALDAAAGQDLAWFWRPWFYGTGVLDQAVTGVQDAGGGRVAITVENRGQLPAPVLLRLTLADGRTLDVKVPATVWLGGARSWTESVAAGGPVRRVVIDPDSLLPDVERANNEWPRK